MPIAVPWPLPALLTWAGAWALYVVLLALAVAPAIAWAVALVAACAAATLGSTPWRRVFMAAGFPLSLAMSGLAGGVSPWLWLLALALLMLVYPLHAWRDAPLFPTPADALDGLAAAAPLPAGARIVDAGCGLGAGLLALRRQYPQAQLEGLECSRPLAWLCAWRCRDAQVRRADIWAADWSAYDMVYVFQRPESMPRAVTKARQELRPGAWLVSLEFEAEALTPVARLEPVDGKPVWLYRAPI
jgi:hypothetical protein